MTNTPQHRKDSKDLVLEYKKSFCICVLVSQSNKAFHLTEKCISAKVEPALS